MKRITNELKGIATPPTIWQKVAKVLDDLRGASGVLQEREDEANDALKSAMQRSA